MPPCEFRWEASRVDAETLPVQHVCNEPEHHEGDHVCSCGARLSAHVHNFDLSTVEWKGRMVPFSLFVMIQSEVAAREFVQVTLDQFPPMNDADVEMVPLGEYWIARVTVWWA